MRREMDSVLTCMVDEKIGPGVLNNKFVSAVKQFFSCDYSVLLRTPKTALKLALDSMGATNKNTTVIIWALSPVWQYKALKELGYNIILVDSQNNFLTAPSAEAICRAVNKGGNLFLLTHSAATPIDITGVKELNIPIIEDITNAISPYALDQNIDNIDSNTPLDDAATSDTFVNDASDSVNNDIINDNQKPGSIGTYSIMTCEEHDTVTTGGGALVMSIDKNKTQRLKDASLLLDKSELLPDLNSALGLVELKEFSKNESIRRTIYRSFERAIIPTKNKTLARNKFSSAAIFPVIIDSSPKDVVAYAKNNGVETSFAFCDSVIAAVPDELKKECPNAASFLLKTLLFPLYPRLSKKNIDNITKVLATLP